jgi:hypothetical protein
MKTPAAGHPLPKGEGKNVETPDPLPKGEGHVSDICSCVQPKIWVGMPYARIGKQESAWRLPAMEEECAI